MDFPFNALIAWVNGYLWPFARIGAMLSVAPIFGARVVPMRVRLIVAVALTLTMQPIMANAPLFDALSAQGIYTMLHQVIIGLVMGLILQIAFAALTLAGQIISMSMGLGFASSVDPQNGVQVPVVGQLYLTIGMLLFFAFNGHLTLVEVLAKSFTLLPVSDTGLSTDVFFGLATWSAIMFTEAMRVALPVLSVVLVTNISFGVATRAAPQLNLFAVGFAATLTIGFAAMSLTLGYFGPVFSNLLGVSFGTIETVLHASP